jgi:formylglycine-generating enzyme required for sulfatase activity
MHGNMMEWCADWYDTYPAGPVTDPTGPASGEYRVIRNATYGDGALFLRSAHRSNSSPSDEFNIYGFRVLGVR